MFRTLRKLPDGEFWMTFLPLNHGGLIRRGIHGIFLARMSSCIEDNRLPRGLSVSRRSSRGNPLRLPELYRTGEMFIQGKPRIE